jgi:hypothetical protein
MPNAFSRDIRSISAQENIGVHSRTPLLTLVSIVVVRPRANLEAPFADPLATSHVIARLIEHPDKHFADRTAKAPEGRKLIPG